MENQKNSVRSLISLIFIIGCFLFTAVIQMEEVRVNYEVLKLNKELRLTMETRRSLEIKKIRALLPQKIENQIQTKTNLTQAGSDQIVHLPNVPSHLKVDLSEKNL